MASFVEKNSSIMIEFVKESNKDITNIARLTNTDNQDLEPAKTSVKNHKNECLKVDEPFVSYVSKNDCNPDDIKLLKHTFLENLEKLKKINASIKNKRIEKNSKLIEIQKNIAKMNTG